MANESRSEIIALAWHDYAAITRTRCIPVKDLERRWSNGLGWATAGYALTPSGRIARNRFGATDEIRLVPDPAARYLIRGFEDSEDCELIFVDALRLEGDPFPGCPREFLRSALRLLEDETGWRVCVAMEHEFTLSSEDYRPETPFSLRAIRSVAPFAEHLVGAAAVAGIDLETVEPEYGMGQFEVTCGPAEGVAGADRIVLTRELIREVARQHGFRASFAPKPSPTAVGNGAHLHFSFRDAENQPAAYDPDEPTGLRDTAAMFVAGVLEHLAGLVAFTAPSPVSYYRLGPGHWSCGFKAFGVQNREAAIRVCPSPERGADQRGDAFNLEFRPMDATANAYLAIGLLVRAGVDGIRRGLPRPQVAHRDPADLSEEERKALGVVPLPLTLDKALAALDEDQLLCTALPEEILETFVSVKRQEMQELINVSPEEACQQYFRIY